MSVFEYLKIRQICDKKPSRTTINGLKNQEIPFLLKSSNISIGKTDKIFASKWLDDRRVLCGTKCNKLFVLDVCTKKKMVIPMLQGSPFSVMPQASAGIHDIAINERRTLLATNGENPNHLAIYRLPTLDPMLIGENHTDWVFGTEWINDKIIATGSRDGTVSVWNTDNLRSSSMNNEVLRFASTRDNIKIRPPILSPKTTFRSPLSEDKIRDLVYYNSTGHLVALSPNAFLYVWDLESEKRLSTIRLPFEFENVCMAMHRESGLCAVGSQSDVSFMDLRTDKNVRSIRTQDIGAGVRSVSFKDSLVTIGTGHGSVLFYDLNSNKYLRKKCGQPLSLKSAKGWLRMDSTVYEFFTEQDVDCFKNAIYTHCYDPSETKLFTAGGPLALVLYGNYAALWD